MFKPRFALAVIFMVASLSFAKAGTGLEMKTTVPMRDEDPFHKGALEFQALTGAFFNVDEITRVRPNIDYAVQTFRLGVILTERHGPGLLAGNLELLGELFGGGIINGPGNGLGGGTLLIRYNFLQPHAFIVPYFQVGGGGLYNDVYRTKSQFSLGSAGEFNLQGSLGARFMVNTRWSVVGECGYRHISNGGLAKPNDGLDSLGGMLGFGVLF